MRWPRVLGWGRELAPSLPRACSRCSAGARAPRAQLPAPAAGRGCDSGAPAQARAPDSAAAGWGKPGFSIKPQPGAPIAHISLMKVASRALGSHLGSQQEVGWDCVAHGSHCSWPAPTSLLDCPFPMHCPLWLPRARRMKHSLLPGPSLLPPPPVLLGPQEPRWLPLRGPARAAPSPASFLLCNLPGVRSPPPHSRSACCPIALEEVTDLGLEPLVQRVWQLLSAWTTASRGNRSGCAPEAGRERLVLAGPWARTSVSLPVR